MFIALEGVVDILPNGIHSTIVVAIATQKFAMHLFQSSVLFVQRLRFWLLFLLLLLWLLLLLLLCSLLLGSILVERTQH